MVKKLNSFCKKSVIEHILFLTLGVLSIILFEARLYSDSSYYISRVINHESFWVEHHRFILIFSQWLPLIGLKIGLSLKSILVLYSIGHVLFFYFLFLICKYRYKDNSAGLMLLALQTLGIMSGFYVPMFELYYAAGFLVLFSTLLPSAKNIYLTLILAILLFFIVTAHFYAYILVAYVLLIHSIKVKFKNFTQLTIFAIILTGCMIFKKLTISEYEYGKSMAFLNTLKNGNYNLNYISNLFDFLLKFYKSLSAIFIASIIGLGILKKYTQLFITLFFFLLVLAMVNISFYGFHQSHYQEQVYFPLSFITAYAFIYLLYPNIFNGPRLLLYGSLILIFMGRIYSIEENKTFYKERVIAMKKFIHSLKKYKSKKIIVSETAFKNDPNWSFPIETMIFSSYNGPENTLTVCTETDASFNKNSEKIEPHQYIFRKWEIYPIEHLNTHYFKLDTSIYLDIR